MCVSSKFKSFYCKIPQEIMQKIKLEKKHFICLFEAAEASLALVELQRAVFLMRILNLCQI